MRQVEASATAFTIRVSAHTTSASPDRSTKRVAISNDESPMRDILERILQGHGYRVVTASEGAEALTLFARRRAEIKLVITDMMMPGLDGPALIQALRRLEPTLPILGMTGLAEWASIKKPENLDLGVLIRKPFGTNDLLEAVHQLLAPATRQPAVS